MDKYKVLKDVFGYDTFREGQEGLIDSTLAGRDVLGIMPTGAGKSICFQVPALLFSGDNHCGVASDFAYEGPGGCFKCSRRTCGFHQQFADRRTV